MKQLKTFVATMLVMAFGSPFAGCSTGDTGASGEVNMSLIVGSTDVTAVKFEITCDSGVNLSGEFNVNDEQDPPVWAAVMDLPPGDCTITLTACDDAGDPLCTGSADFTVVENETVKVNIVLACPGDGDDPLGNVDIDATFEIVEGNSCPRLHFLNVVPDEVPPEGSAVTVLVSDADGDTVSTMLTATGGSFGDPSALSTTYTCDDASGTQTVSVKASDGDTACDKDKSFDVTCPGVNPCDGVQCPDTGNECTTSECNPSTGQCETSNVPNGTTCEVGGGGGELTTNGDFETGNTDGWTSFAAENNGTFGATMAQSNGGAWSGNLVASVPAGGGPPSFPVVKQANIGIGTVQPNSSCDISFDLFGSVSGPGGVFFAEFFSELDGGGTSSSVILGGSPLFPNGTWTTYPFTTPTGDDVSGGVTLQLKADCGANPGCTVDAFIDNVSVTCGNAVTTLGSGGGPGTCQEGVCEPSDLCEGVPCDDGNECTADACNPANGECESTATPGASCDGGAGTCDAAGTCQPNDLCAGNTCDDEDTECSDSSCDPGTGQCVATPINEGGDCDGGNGTCNAGACESTTVCEYEQNFNELPIDGEFIGDGWLFFVNVFNSGGGYKFGYGDPAPNGPQISALVAGEGGPEQEPQQLSVYSDYNCCGADEGHKGTDLVETNVFRERAITSDDVGKTLTFTFDAKATPPPFGVGGATTANGFIKTLVPGPFNESAADRADTTNLPDAWGTFAVSLVVDGTTVAVGHVLQYGFQTNASDEEPSGNFYDNAKLTSSPTP